MDWTFHLQTVTRPIANNAIKHNGCWGLVIFPVWVEETNDRMLVVLLVDLQKGRKWDILFECLGCNFYDIVAVPNFIIYLRKMKLRYVYRASEMSRSHTSFIKINI